MNRILLVLILIISSLTAFSQASRRTLNYQAVIIDPSTKDIPGTGLSNQPYSNGKLCIRFSFFNPQKELEYEEIQEDSTDAYGLVDLSIGLGKQPLVYSGTTPPLFNTFETVIWTSDTKTLKVAISLDGCKTFSEVSSQLLTYTPYSFYADNVKYSNVQNAPTKLSQFLNDKQYVSLNDLDTLIARVAILKQVVLENTAKINVNTADILLKAPLASPALTGTPTAPTAPNGTNSEQIATTAFVTSMLGGAGTGNGVSLGGDLGGTRESPTVNTVGGVSSSTISSLPITVAYNTASITALESRINSNNASITTNISSNTASITSLTNQIQSTASSITSNNNYISEVDARVLSNTFSLTALEAKVQSNTQSITSNSNDIAALNTRVDSNTASITAEVTRATAAELALTNSVNANTASINSNSAAISDLDNRVSLNTTNITSEILRATAAEAVLSTGVNANTASITSISQTIAGIDSRVTSNTNSVTAYSNLITDLETRVISNTNSITTEVNRATAAELVLSNGVNANTTSITSNTNAIAGLDTRVTSNTSSLTAEISRAIDADLTLTNGVNANTNSISINTTAIADLETRVASNTSSITAEVTRATSAELTLTNVVNANTASISTNTSAITGLDTRVSSNTSSITAEISRAIAAELTLTNGVNSNTASISINTIAIADLETRVTSNTNSLTAEVTRATAAELVLTNSVNANNLSITANANNITANTLSITTVSNNIAANVASITANTNAITALDTRVTSNTTSITTETARAIAAELALTNSVNANTASITTYSNIVAGIDTRITANTMSITAEVARATSADLALTNEVNANTASITANSIAIAGLDTRVTSNTTSLTAEISRATSAELVLTNSVNANSNSITTNTNAIADLETRVTSNTSSITAEVSRAIAAELALANGINSNTISITSNNSAIAAIDARVILNINNLSSEIQRATAAEQILTNGVNSLTASITTNNSALSDLDTRITSNTNAIAGLDTRVTSNTNSITAEVARATAAELVLSNSVNANTASITSNTSSIAGLETRVTSNTNSITSLDTRVTSNTNSITAEVARATAAELVLSNSINANTTSITSNTSSIAGLETRVTSNTNSITAEVTRATAADLVLTNSVNANTVSITSNTNAITGLDTRVTSNASDILLRATINSPALTGTPTAPTAALATNTTQIATTEFVQSVVQSGVQSGITASATPDANSTTKGKLKLTNDLGGTADLPTVNMVGGVSSTTISTLPTSVASNTASITANITDIALRATINSPSLTGTPTAPTADPGTNSTQIATTEFVQSLVQSGVQSGINSSSTPDANSSTKGKLKLTNDLGGSADLPTVVSVGGVSSTTIATLPTSVAANTLSITANTISIAANTESITTNTSDIALRATINSPSLTGTPTAPTAAPGTSTNQLATTAFVSTMVGGTYTPDADATNKGKLKLTNDLGGTADLPTVNSVGGVSSSTISTLPTLVASNTSSITANTISIASNTSSITTEIARAQAAELTLTNNVTANTNSITANTISIAANTESITTNTSDIALRATINSPSLTGTPTAPTAAPGTSTNQLATTAFVSTMVGGTYTPDADATNKGKLKLTNDLGGTADLPTVNSVGGVSSSTISTLPTLVASNTSSITANTISIASNTSSITTEIARAQAAELTLTNNVTANTNSITANTISIAANTASITTNTSDIALRATINSPSFTGTPTVPAPAANSNSNQIATTAFVTTLVGGASIADANSTTKGKLKLTNDLGGTADLPTVNSVGGVSSSTIATLPTSVIANTASITSLTNSVASNTSSLTSNTTSIASNTASLTSMFTDLALKATINSPSFTGTPTVPAPASNSNSNQIATTAFVNNLLSGFSGGSGSLTLTGAVTGSGSGSITTTISPSLALSGVPTAPTATDPLTNSTQIATTAFVQSVVSSLPGGANYLNPSTLNVGNTLVKRASDGSFAAGAITATSFIGNVTGTAANITGLLPIMNGGTNATNITDARTNLGLGNVDNTSDVNKPVSTAQLAALNLKANLLSPVFTGTPSLPTGTIAVTQGTGDISTAIATTAFVSNSFTTTNIAAGVPTATSTIAGKIMLAGDLGGTFSSPTVVSVGGQSNTDIANATTTVEAATTINTPSTLVMRSATGGISVGSISSTTVTATTLSGNLTGNVVGNVTGNVSGTALNVTGVVAIANGGTNATNITDARTNLGLGNVDNTSDVNKPVSTAQLAALNLKANLLSPVFTGTPTLPTGTIAVTQSASDASTAIATTAFVNNAFTSTNIAAGVPSATASIAGKIMLAGDLGGTFSSPTVVSVGGQSNTDIANATTTVEAATTINTPSTLVMRSATGGISVGSISSTTVTATTLSGNLTGNVVGNVTGNVSGTALNVTGVVAIANGGTNATNITDARTNLGLGNVDNTSDVNKPVSTAQLAALNLKANLLSPVFTGTPTLPTGTIAVTQSASDASTAIATTAFVNNAFTSTNIAAGVPSATASIAGKIMLAGDLGGTFSSPTVVSVGGQSNTDIANATTTVEAATTINTPSTLVMRSATGGISVGSISSTTVTATTLSGNLTGNVVGNVTGNVSGTALNVTGVVAIANGGTNATNITDARTNLGLGNVDNTSDVNKPVSTAQLAALNLKANLLSPVFTGTPTLPTGTIAVTQSASDASTAIATTAFVNNAFTSTNIAAGVPSATASIAGKIMLAGDLGGTFSSPTVVSVGGQSNTDIANATTTVEAATSINTPSTLVMRNASGNFAGNVITANTLVGNYSGIIALANGGTGATTQAGALTALGLDQVNNTSDLNKPISTATQNALNLKVNSSLIGAINGVASLGSDGKVPTAQLPAFQTTSTNVVTSTAAMYALTGLSLGAVVINTTDKTTWILSSVPGSYPSTAANWTQLTTSTTVSSVNGLTGAVALTGTANRVTVSAANIFDIASTYTGQNSINTLGTITTGTWNGTAVGTAFGGTGANTANAGFNALAPSQSGNSGKFLTTDGSNTSWSTMAAAGGWATTGNTGMTDYTISIAQYVSETNAGKFIGTTDGYPLNFRVANVRSGRIDNNVNIGQTSFGFGAGQNAWLENNSGNGYRGTKNTAIGYNANYSTNVGKENTSLGYQTLYNNQSGSGSVALGYQSMMNYSNSYSGSPYYTYNTALGYQSLMGPAGSIASNQSTYNTAVGYQSMYNTVSGGYNVGLGIQTLFSNNNGYYNNAIGYQAMYSNTSGQMNVGAGYQALYSVTTGSNNIGLGGYAGNSVTTGSNNTLLGYGANVNNGALTNATAIGNGASVDASNKLVLGNTSVSLVQTTGRWYTTNNTDATATNTGALQVAGGAGIGLQLRVGGATTLTGATQINNTLGVTGITSITNTTDASSVSTGSLVLSGGLGVASQLRVGGNVTFGSSSILNVTNTTASSATNNGALIVGGGAGIGGNLNVAGNTAISGTLNVSGATAFSSGNVTGVTPATNDNSTKFATTAYVLATMSSAANGVSWATTGNTGMTDYSFSLAQYVSETNAGKFIGNTDGYPLNFRVANVRSGRIDNNVNIGQTSFGFGAGQNAWLENNSGNGYRGTKNTAIGYNANYSTNVGKENTSLGYQTLYNNQSGSGSVALGYQSMMNYSNSYSGSPYYTYNTALGYQSLMGPAGSIASNTNTYNTAVGYQSMYNTVSGGYNVGLGIQTLFSNNNGYYNNAIGYQAMYSNTSGQMNVADGYQALYSVTTGSNNIGLGGYAGNSVTTGSNNTLLGYGANVNNGALTNATAIGNGASVDASNKLVLGNTSVSLVQTTGRWYTTNSTDATATNTGALQVAGGAGIGLQLRVGGATTLTGATQINNTLGVTGITSITNTTDASSVSTGSLVLSGGLGVASQLRVGGNVTFGSSSILNVTNTTASSATNNGALIVGGGAGIGGNLNVAGNTAISGTLNVSGATAFSSGNVTGVTPATNDNSTKFATTAYVLATMSSAANGVSWATTGNTGMTDYSFSLAQYVSETNAGKFIGNTDGYPLNFRVANVRSGRIDNNVNIGQTSFGFGAGQNAWLENNSGNGYRGTKNTAIGYNANYSTNVGKENTSLGYQTLYNNQSGSGSVALGYQSMMNYSNSYSGSPYYTYNTALGYQSLMGPAGSIASNQSTYNTAVGYQSMYNTVSGGYNVGLGIQTLFSNNNGYYNNAIGYQAMYSNTSGQMNVGAGYQALYSVTTGSNNIGLGGYAGNSVTTGSNNTLLGYGANVNNGALTNATAIGNGASVDASNKLVLGNTSVSLVQTTGRWYTTNSTDATATNTGALQVAGGAGIGLQLRVGGATTLTGATQINNTLGVTGITSITNTTDASSVSTGSLVLSGGLGVASQLRVGGNVTFGSSSILNVTNTTASSATNNGALIVGGGAGIGGNLNVAGNTAISGTLNVSGATAFSSGNVTGVTPATNDNSTKFATTAYVLATMSSAANGVSWATTGNTGMTDYSFSLAQYVSETNAGKFIGNTDGYPLNFRVANVRSGRIDNNVNIGQTSFGFGAGQNAWLENNSGNGYRGTKNTAIGYNANYSTNVGKENTSLGYQTLYNNQSGSGSVALGYQSMMNYSNSYSGSPYYTYNTALGYQSLMGPAGSIASNQSTYNTAVGYQSMYNTVSGGYNVGLGIQTLFSNNNGYYNNAIGYQAMYSNTSGQMNVGAGYQALYSVTTGSNNIGLGGYAGNSVTTGSNNTLLGYGANVNNGALTNATAIGNGASVDASNKLVLGNTSVSLVQTTGRWYTTNSTDATATNTGALQVAGGAGIGLQLRVGGATTLTGATQINNTLGVTGITSITNTTDASSVSTGSLVLSGGLGVASQLRVGGNVTFGSSSILNVTNTTASSATNNGALIVGGGAGIGGNLNVGGTLNVSGATAFSSGNVTGVTPATNDNSTKFATTAYVISALTSTGSGLVWNATGNTGMTDYAFGLAQNISETNAGKFIGTTDGYPLNFRVANVRSGRIDNNVNIGQTSFGYGAGQNAWLENNSGNGYRGTKNTAIGYNANYSTNVGKENTSLGYQTLYNNQSGSGSVALGYQSMMNYSNSYSGSPYYTYNTALGYQSLMGPAGSIASNQSTYNTAVGYQSMYNTVSGGYNVGLGIQTLFSNNNGYYNNAIGYQAMYSNTSGQMNVGAGYQALYSVTTGSNNIGLGGYAGNSVTTGSNNTLLGYGANVNNGALTNATAIGNGASVDASNKLVLGNTSVSLVQTTGRWYTTNSTDATATNTGALQVAGGAGIGLQLRVGGATTLTGATQINNTLGVTGITSITNTTDASSVSTGSLVLSGGLGVASQLRVGGNVTFGSSSILNVTNTTASSATNNGALIVGGGAGIGGNLNVGGTLNVSGATAFSSGNVTGVTPATNDNSTKFATTAYVMSTLGSAANALVWNATGNTSMTDYSFSLAQNISETNAGKFIGTTDGYPLNFRVANVRSGRIDNNVNIGQTSFGYGAGQNAWLENNSGNGYRGTKNTAIGYNANYSTNVGKENTSLGYQTLYNNQSGSGSVALGYQSMMNYSNSYSGSPYYTYNTALGYQSLMGPAGSIASNTNTYNTAVGYQSMYNTVSGGYNVGLGIQTLFSNNNGYYNNAIGYQAMYSNTSGQMNVGAGYQALYSVTTGSNNIGLGGYAGNSVTTGSNNTLIGYDADVTSATLTNATAIGNGASVAASNTVRIGNTAITSIGGQVAWTAASDVRIKKNIIDTKYGLETVLKLRPVEYNLISNDLRQVGFIAQEVQKLVPEVVTGKEGNLSKGEILGITYSNLVPVLAKAVQELYTQKNEEIAALKTSVANITAGESLSVKHLKGNSSTPAIEAAAGSGSMSAVKITGTDMSGVIEVTIGETPTADAILATIQYSTAYSSAPVVIITPGNAATASLMGTSTVFVGNNTTTNFTLNTNATPLASKTFYKWYYQVIQ